MMWEWATFALGLWAAASFGPTTSALWRGSKRATHRADELTTKRAPARVLVVRPCAGNELELVDTLSSMFTCDAGASVHVRFAVAREDDEAMPAVRAAHAALVARGVSADILMTHAAGLNRKVEQIAKAIAGMHHTHVVVADSDLDLTGFSLDGLLAALRGPTVFAAWAPPIESGSRTFADRVSASVLDGSFQSFPFLKLVDRRTMVGKLFAFRPELLARVGHLESLVGHLGEDMELARRAHAGHLSVVSVDAPASSRMSGRSLKDVVLRYARWIQVVRAQRPWLLVSYPWLVFPLPLIAIATTLLAVLAPPSPLTVLPLATAVVARCALFAVARRLSRRSALAPMSFALSLVGDLVLLVAFARALSTRKLVWRGNVLELGPRGLLQP